jgi:hypothetical protein
LAGRGIPPRLAKERDDEVRQWPNNEPPEPDWSWLDGQVFVPDDIPEQPEPDEPIFEVPFQCLELTDHQKHMLKSPEDRVSELIFPASIKSRVRNHRRLTRKNKWASKFKGLFTGKSARKWAERLKGKGGRATLTSEARGRAKVSIKAKAQAEPLLKKLKKKMVTEQKAEKRQRKTAKTLEE